MEESKIMTKSEAQIADILGQAPPKFKPEPEKYKGVMIYDHKTAGSIQIMDASSFSNWKGYQPGRHGRSAVKKAGGKNTAFI